MYYKSILTLLLAVLPMIAFSKPQTDEIVVVEVANHVEKVYYIEIVYNLYSTRVYLGKELATSLGVEESTLRKRSKSLSFNGTIEALNYWGARGWNYKGSFTTQYDNSLPETHLIMEAKGDSKDILKSIMED